MQHATFTMDKTCPVKIPSYYEWNNRVWDYFNVYVQMRELVKTDKQIQLATSQKSSEVCTYMIVNSHQNNSILVYKYPSTKTKYHSGLTKPSVVSPVIHWFNILHHRLGSIMVMIIW